MENLQVIENELMPVYGTDTGEKVVNGRELHEYIKSKRQFADWIKQRLNECDAVENIDFTSFSQICEKGLVGRPAKEYLIKLDTAKEMAMLERNERGKLVRRYFIEVEKKYRLRQSNSFGNLSPQLQYLISLETKVDKIENEVSDIKESLPLMPLECDNVSSQVKRKGVELLGGKESKAYNDRTMRAKVYSALYQQIKGEFGVSSYKAIKRKHYDVAIELVQELRIPFHLQESIKYTNAQMNLGV